MSQPWVDDWWAHRLDPASIWQRAAAAGVDILLVGGAVTAFYWFIRGFDDVVLRYLDPTLRETLPPRALSDGIIKIVGLTFLSLVIYGVLMEPAPWSGTFGKRLVRIRVVDEYGERLTFTAAIVRNLTKIVSVAALGIGLLAILWRPGHQAWHDLAARSFVAKG
jgi:uncharacterized RDD family membrane protein YckC